MKTQNCSETEFDSPPPAFFDEAASANAQPVQPIPTGGIGGWVQRCHDIRLLLSARTKALGLVVVVGLAFGTLGGTMLVKKGQSSPADAPTSQEAVAETIATPVGSGTTPVGSGNRDSNDETAALDDFANTLKRPGPASSDRRHRFRPRVQHTRRAYRVAVIRYD